MKFASGVSDSVQLLRAVDEACRQVLDQLAGAPCHLALFFASPMYRLRWAEALAALNTQLTPSVLIGCSAGGVIGGDHEFEGVPAVSIVAASLPGVRLASFTVSPDALERSSPGGFWIDTVGIPPAERPILLLLADLFTAEPPRLIGELNQTFPNCPMIGGLVSGGERTGDHLLFCDTQILSEGAVGLAMTGNVHMETIISQGCRPIGRPMIITKAEENIVWELGGRQAIEVLREVLIGLSLAEQELAQRAIFAGLVINEMKAAFRPGDFLIRDLVGIDPPSGAIAVSDDVQVGQTMQFQLRDPGASRHELRRLMAERSAELHTTPPAGALLFNCVGRGKSFYGVSHHDMRTIRTFSGKLPVGGFFSNGEIGPVGGTNFLHGYTASLGLFRPAVRPVPCI